MQDKPKLDTYLEYTSEMESCLLSAAVVGPDFIDSVMEIVGPDDFRDPVNGKVWDILINMRDSGKKVDARMVMGQVMKQGFAGQFKYADYGKLLAKGASPHDIQYYAEEVARLSAHRKMMWAAMKLLNEQDEIDFDPKRSLAQFEANTQSALVDQTDGIQLKDSIKRTLGKHKESATSDVSLSIPTGFRDLDDVIGGYYPGHLMMIPARSFMGKTTLALNMLAKLAFHGRSCLFFSLEMTDIDLSERMLSFLTGTPYSHFNRGFISAEKADALLEETKFTETWKARIYQKPRQTVRNIRAISRLYRAVNGLDVIFVDNLQLVAGMDPRLVRHERLLDNSGRFKELAKELNCTVVLLNQLNGLADGEEPDDSHLAGSKEVLTDVDEMIYLHRPTKTSRETLLKVTKARKGGQGRVNLEFDGAIQLFRDAPQKDILQ